MTYSILTLSVFFLCSSMAFLAVRKAYGVRYGYARHMGKQLGGLDTGNKANVQTSIFKNVLEQNSTKRRRVLTWLNRLLMQSNSGQSAKSILASCVVMYAVAAYLSVAVVLESTYEWAGLLIALPFGMTPIFYLLYRRKTRMKAISRQLPQVFQTLSRTVRSGQTIPAAMQMVSNTCDGPLAEEFALCCDQQRLGLSREAALREMGDRTGVMELQMFIVAILVQTRSGGDVMAMFDNLAKIVRKRQKFDDRVRALTGEGRAQAVVLIALPIVAFIGLYLMSPEYMSTLLQKPSWLISVVVAQIVGAVWINRITTIDV